MHYAERVKNEYPQYDVRAIRDTLQRGGSPTAHDRIPGKPLGCALLSTLSWKTSVM